MALQVTSLYASVLAIAAIMLALVVSTKRGKYGVSILDGGHPELALWIRKHGNFAEAVPLALLMMALAELRGMPAAWLYAIGGLLLISRVAHVYGLTNENPTEPFRIAGTVGTHLTILGAVAYLAWSLA
jgi:uncharacterized protein